MVRGAVVIVRVCSSEDSSNTPTNTQLPTHTYQHTTTNTQLPTHNYQHTTTNTPLPTNYQHTPTNTHRSGLQGCHVVPEGEMHKLSREELLRRHRHPHPRLAPLCVSVCVCVCVPVCGVCLCVCETRVRVCAWPPNSSPTNSHGGMVTVCVPRQPRRTCA